jgi:hypothetical protein
MPVAAPVHTALWQLRRSCALLTTWAKHDGPAASSALLKKVQSCTSAVVPEDSKSQCAADAHIWCGTLSTGNSQCTYLLQMVGRWQVNTIVYWMTLEGTTGRMSMEQVDLELIEMMLMWRPHGCSDWTHDWAPKLPLWWWLWCHTTLGYCKP